MIAPACSTLLWCLSIDGMLGAISMSTDGVLTVDGKVDFVNNTARDGGGACAVVPAGIQDCSCP